MATSTPSSRDSQRPPPAGKDPAGAELPAKRRIVPFLAKRDEPSSGRSTDRAATSGRGAKARKAKPASPSSVSPEPVSAVAEGAAAAETTYVHWVRPRPKPDLQAKESKPVTRPRQIPTSAPRTRAARPRKSGPATPARATPARATPARATPARAMPRALAPPPAPPALHRTPEQILVDASVRWVGIDRAIELLEAARGKVGRLLSE